MDRQRRPASPRSAEAIDTVAVAVAVAVAVDAGQVQVQSSSSPTIGGTNFRDLLGKTHVGPSAVVGPLRSGRASAPLPRPASRCPVQYGHNQKRRLCWRSKRFGIPEGTALMLFSEALGRTVVSTDTASTVGRVSDYVVNPRLPGGRRVDPVQDLVPGQRVAMAEHHRVRRRRGDGAPRRRGGGTGPVSGRACRQAAHPAAQAGADDLWGSARHRAGRRF